MNSTAWNLWLATLPAERRDEYGIVLERISKIVDEMRNLTLDDLQRVERRQSGLSDRQGEIVARLDAYEEQRGRDVQREFDRIRADTITREEHDALMVALYELTARIQQLEPLADLLIRVQALEQRFAEWQARERGGDAEQRR
jgi:hypothetical protein